MSSVSRSDNVGRVEHVVFGCPGDLGFKVIATSAPMTREERQALMGLSDQGSGAMLAAEAITVVDLGARYAILVTNPDATPGTRAGLVVTHAFLVSHEDYALVDFDPFALLASVRGSCGPLPPKRAELAHDLSPGSAPRVDRLRQLPLQSDLAAEVAPVVAAVLLDGQVPGSVRSEVAMLGAELAIGVMSIDRRRSFTFATADFSEEATKLDLVGALEPTHGAGEPTNLLAEIEWLLMQEPRAVASVAERLERSWPRGATADELTAWLSARRELSGLERSENWKKIVSAVESLVSTWDGDEVELTAAGRLLGRALTLEETFAPKARQRVVSLLEGSARAELTAGILDGVDEFLCEAGAVAALRGRALLAGWAGARSVTPDVLPPFSQDLGVCLKLDDPSIAGLFVAVLESEAPISHDQLQAIEWFAWRHSEDALRRMTANQIEVGLDEADLARIRRDRLLDLVEAERPDWVESWFEERGELANAEALQILDLLVNDGYPGVAREKAVGLVLDALGDADLGTDSNVPHWLQRSSDQCAALVFDRITRDAKPPAEAAPALKVIRRLLTAGESHQPGSPVARAIQLLDGWLSRSPHSPAAVAAGLASADRAQKPKRRSWTRWFWPFRRSSRQKGPSHRPRGQHGAERPAGDRVMLWFLLLVLTLAVAAALFVKFGGGALL